MSALYYCIFKTEDCAKYLVDTCLIFAECHQTKSSLGVRHCEVSTDMIDLSFIFLVKTVISCNLLCLTQKRYVKNDKMTQNLA